MSASNETQILRLMQNDPGLTECDFVHLKDDETTLLMDSLRSNTQLKQLRLSHSRLGKRVVALALPKALQGNTTLKELDLYRSFIGYDVAMTFGVLHGNQLTT